MKNNVAIIPSLTKKVFEPDHIVNALGVSLDAGFHSAVEKLIEFAPHFYAAINPPQ
ncbi:hypothetical protein [Necropsobacter massiliensis]|uniref:hypothetical protein n=1 Tax=Necropsobacter massiliensis TaxID=1400001 RepID=UPI000AB4594C|nr:hypothetical protein [Necropsobacter massiliensis]